MTTFIVHNLSTGEQVRQEATTPADAVTAAYARAHGDTMTWGYGQYRELLAATKTGVIMGDWAVLTRKGA